MTRLGVVLVLLLALSIPAQARAAFPGADGPVVFAGDPAHGAGASLFRVGAGAVSPFRKAASQQSGPATSPDGRWIAYAQDRDIWIARSDGKGAPRRVTRSQANDSAPAFSPDGKRLAFVRTSVGVGDLFVVGVNGKGLHNVSNDPLRIDDAPDWSPDGSRIAFAGDPCFTDGPGAPQGGPCVFVMNADGSGKVNLTPEEKRDECDPANQNAGYSHAHHSDDPSWSPDGSRIAFSGYFDICKQSSGGGTDIWVMNADGSGKTDLMSDVGTPDVQPAWSPSGSAIAFVSDREGPGLFTIPAGGGAVTRLTTGADADPYWGPPAKPCVVPKLKGKTLAAAKKRIAAAGCTTGKVKRKKGVKKGRVASSKPRAGKSVRAWTPVALVVGK